LYRELTDPIEFEEISIFQNLEEISLNDSMSLSMWILSIPEKIVVEIRENMNGQKEFLASKPLQETSEYLSKLCDTIAGTEEDINASVEVTLMSQRAEEVKERFDAYDTLINKLEEAKVQVGQLNEKKDILEDKLEDIIKKKEIAEQQLKELQRKDREYIQMEEKVKNLDNVKKELEILRMNEQVSLLLTITTIFE
jgi:DNA repair ATPase RecN